MSVLTDCLVHPVMLEDLPTLSGDFSINSILHTMQIFFFCFIIKSVHSSYFHLIVNVIFKTQNSYIFFCIAKLDAYVLLLWIDDLITER